MTRYYARRDQFHDWLQITRDTIWLCKIKTIHLRKFGSDGHCVRCGKFIGLKPSG